MNERRAKILEAIIVTFSFFLISDAYLDGVRWLYAPLYKRDYLCYPAYVFIMMDDGQNQG